ncbi:ABC transporter substrate-binding protein [Oceanobacillus jeddahense]|uniref:ABC transporter substrate-binding protein n=1 Tax=Oceanobacillus jeddahense TaxID=1462527 RepID=A0ABY5JYR9_9BACI|nr:ABC transporter substrate-binding protein [Oceanobacillus jeddahense]UUI05567.1 ABC transporter substrate-binding protein [Oceanobacillus jeddahense]
MSSWLQYGSLYFRSFHDFVQHAGGQPGSDVLGLENSSSASIEHIIEMDPDYIILAEWSATSDEFTELIESEGFQTLSAVENDLVKQMPAKDISQANRFVVDQLEELSEWFQEDVE